ncbi:MAG TPA: NAD-dependent epimerase/dehydratase family protein [Methanomassiliicoccales archaeon]|jgi:nucleoside-diphosphate-sugar epimerase
MSSSEPGPSGRILVTGATGQIGSELVPELRKRYGRDNVVAAGHVRKPTREMEDAGPFLTLDLMDLGALSETMKKEGIDQVYHLAAMLSAVGEERPQEAWNINMTSLKNVLDASLSVRVDRVFWPSSIAAFGPTSPRNLTPQDTALRPTSMYGVTKVAGELLSNYYFLKYGLDTRSVRYPGIISSETPPGGGTTDYAVAIFYEAILHGHYVCFVREDTALPMLYMPDCINAAVQLMESHRDQVRRHDAYNLAGMSFSAGELAGSIKSRMPGFSVEYRPDSRQQIADSWPRSLDDSEARQDWGWKPYFDREEMVEDMLSRLERKLKDV